MSKIIPRQKKINDDILRRSLIGKKVRILDSSDPSLKGVEGTVIDETKHMLKIRKTSGREILVPKKDSWFEFTFHDGKLRVKGDLLLGLPHKRLVKRFPKRWRYWW